MIVDVIQNIVSTHEHECFPIANSIPISQYAHIVDLPVMFYNSLEPCDVEIPCKATYNIVKSGGKLYMLKATMFPGDEYA